MIPSYDNTVVTALLSMPNPSPQPQNDFITICATGHTHSPGTGRERDQRSPCSIQQWPPHNTSRGSWRPPSCWRHSLSYRERGQTKCSARKMPQRGCWQQQQEPFSPCMPDVRVCLGALVLEIVGVRTKKRTLPPALAVLSLAPCCREKICVDSAAEGLYTELPTCRMAADMYVRKRLLALSK